MSIFAARQDTEVLKRYRDAGVDRAVIMVGSKGWDATLKDLDAAAAVARGRCDDRDGDGRVPR